MNSNEYQEATRRTRPNGDKEKWLFQGALGIASEAGEVTGLLEKHVCQGHPLDKEKVIKEVGDVLWYAAMVMDGVETTFEEVMEHNIEKLKKRFPEKFNTEDSVKRVDQENG